VEHQRVAWLDLHDGVEHTLPPVGDNCLTATFHPDGRTLLFEVYNGGESVTLWEQRLDGSKSRQLTTGGHELSPDVAPDGHLFFRLGDYTHIFSAHPLDDTPAHRVGPNGMWFGIEPTLDGKSLISTKDTLNGRQIFLINLADDSEQPITKGQLPALAPDGERLFLTDEERKTLWSVRLDGSARRLVAQLPAEVSAVYTSRDAVHLQLDRETHTAWRQPYDGSPGAPEGPPGTVAMMPAADGWTVAWGPERRVMVWPPGPPPKTLPKPTRFYDAMLTADRRSFVAQDDEDVMWLVSIADGRERKLAVVHNLVDAALSPDGKTLYTLDDLRRSQRALLSNYASLPRL
jgi:hypothetical protein